MKKTAYKKIKKPIFLFILYVISLPDFIIFPQIKDEKLFKDISQKTDSQLLSNAENALTEGNIKRAIDYLKSIINNPARKLNQEALLAASLRLGDVLVITGNFKESQKYYKEALSLAEKQGQRESRNYCLKANEIHDLFSEALASESKSRYEDALAKLDKAITLSKEIKNTGFEIKCLREKSLVYWATNKLQDFFALNLEIQLLAEQLNYKEDEAKSLNCIGIFYWKIENFSEALKYYEKSLSLSQQVGDLKSEAACINNISLVYYDLGNIDRALENLKKALVIDQKLGDEINISIDLTNIGTYFRMKGFLNENKRDILSALEYYYSSLSIVKKHKKTNLELSILNNIGNAYSYLGDNSKALKYLSGGYDIAKKLSDSNMMGRILNNMGIVHANMGNYEQSTRCYQEAVALALKFKGDRILWESYLEIANAYKKQGIYDQAILNYKKSIEIIEGVRSQISLEELKATYMGSNKRIEAYRNLLDMLVTLNTKEPGEKYGEEAFDFLERSRARAFLDSLEISQVEIIDGASQALINQEAEVMNEVSQIYTKLLTPQLTAEQKKELQQKLDEYEQQLESIKRNIRESSPEYAGLKYPQIIGLKEAQRELADSSTVFLSYSLAKDISYAFALSRHWMKIFPLPPLAEIRARVQAYNRTLGDAASRDFQQGYDLFQKFVKPGLDQNIKTIIIVPDDILHFLPFEALLTRNDDSSWLIKDYKVAYAPSLSSLREIKDREKSHSRKTRKDLLAFGDPDFGASETGASGDVFQNFYSNSAFKFFRLKYSGLEIQKIAALFDKKKIQVFQREQASEETLKALDLRDFKIIHFATHGLIDDKKPGRSSIILRLDPDPREDGFLQMREIFNLKLHADLVSLSACSTGGGQLVRGEGIEGLSRAFFYAGAPSVLMSLWAINDQAACQLMERFYFHLRSSKSLIDALRLAKMEMIEAGTLAHPNYWAAFIISGDSSKVIFPRRWPAWLLAGLALGAGAILAALLMNRRSRKRNRFLGGGTKRP